MALPMLKNGHLENFSDIEPDENDFERHILARNQVEIEEITAKFIDSLPKRQRQIAILLKNSVPKEDICEVLGIKPKNLRNMTAIILKKAKIFTQQSQ